MKFYIAFLIIGLTFFEAFASEVDHFNDCKVCHTNAKNKGDQLVLLDGTIVSSIETAKICAQCHGEKFQEWKDGMHGKDSGGWKKSTKKLTCVECHNPHSPKFKSMIPLKPPKQPKFLVPKRHMEQTKHE